MNPPTPSRSLPRLTPDQVTTLRLLVEELLDAWADGQNVNKLLKDLDAASVGRLDRRPRPLTDGEAA